MRLGIAMPVVYAAGRLDPARWASRAEELGFDDVWFVDHVIFRAPMTDIMVSMALAAGATERVHVCSGIMQAGLRHPVALAKWLGALSFESEGRIVAGLGVGGDLAAEWNALGIGPQDRGARFDEILDVLPRLLRNEPVAHDGRFYKFSCPSLFVEPPPHVPILVGARKPAAIRRSVRANGWLASYCWPDAFRETVASLRSEIGQSEDWSPAVSIVASIADDPVEARQRCSQFFQTMLGVRAEATERRSIGGLDRVVELATAYREAGASRLMITLVDPPGEGWERLTTAIKATAVNR